MAITGGSLVGIGDDVTFNMGSHLQSHTLEDGAFKSDQITVGNGCTVGTGALRQLRSQHGGPLRHWTADSFLMKGSIVEPGARWRGNPASELPRELPIVLPALGAGRDAELQAA